MSLSQIQLLQINKQVDRILHTMGNRPGTNGQLEIAFVLDMCSDLVYIKETAKTLAGSLKRHDKVFENVRFNLVYWNHDKCSTMVVPLSFVAIGRIELNTLTGQGSCLIKDEIQPVGNNGNSLEKLTAYLKLYHARSKCILVISDGSFISGNNEKLVENLNPFLKTKMLIVTPKEIISGSRINADAIKQH